MEIGTERSINNWIILLSRHCIQFCNKGKRRGSKWWGGKFSKGLTEKTVPPTLEVQVLPMQG